MSMSGRGSWLSLYNSIVKRVFQWRPFRRLRNSPVSLFRAARWQMCHVFPLSFFPHTGLARGNFTVEYKMKTTFTSSSFLFYFAIFTNCFTDYLLTFSFVLVYYLLPRSRVSALYYTIQSGLSRPCSWYIYHVLALGFDFTPPIDLFSIICLLRGLLI